MISVFHIKAFANACETRWDSFFHLYHCILIILCLSFPSKLATTATARKYVTCLAKIAFGCHALAPAVPGALVHLHPSTMFADFRRLHRTPATIGLCSIAERKICQNSQNVYTYTYSTVHSTATMSRQSLKTL